MAITFNEIDKQIEISPETTVTIQELIDAIRTWEELPEAMDNPSVANCTGKQALGGGKFVGLTLELLDDWRLYFGDKGAQTFCFITGGNLVPTYLGSEPPLAPSTNVNGIIELDTSAALLDYSGEIGNEITRILGLTQENFRVYSQVYDGDGNMTSGRIRLYNSKADADADTNHFAEYLITATYSAPGRCTSYKVTKE
jgi:hypothetical protein